MDVTHIVLLASMFCKSCNCNSSIATRIGFAVCIFSYLSIYFLAHAFIELIFLFNSMLAWIMKTPFAINLIQKWSYDYIKMDCEGGKCYGVPVVRMNLLLKISSMINI